MTVNELANMEQFSGLPVVDGEMLGVFKRYPYSLTIKNKGSRDVVTLNFGLSKAAPGKLRKIIKQGLPKGSSVTIQTLKLVVTFQTEGDRDTYQLTVEALNLVTSTLSSAEKPLYPPEKCPVCRQGNCDSAALVGVEFVPVHRDCATERNQNDAEKAGVNQQSGSYLLGLIGALLGAIVGCIPTIIFIFLAEREYGILYAAIPLASYFGYELLKGRSGGGARIIVILCSLVAFILLKPAYYYTYLISEGIQYLSLPMVFLWYYVGTPISEVLGDIWFGALFLIIGIVTSFNALGTTNADKIRSAAARQNSIVPLNASYINTVNPNEALID